MLSRLGVATIAVVALAAAIAAWWLIQKQRDASAEKNDPAVLAYGYGPRPNRHVRYQPDVVLIGDGPHVIRSVSPDELTWTIDARAKGADQLAVGKIMFATSRAVGRVMAIQPRGNDLAVTLGPVTFTEVVRDAKIDIDMKLNPDLFISYPAEPPRVITAIPVAKSGGTAKAAVWRPTRARHLRRTGGKLSAKVTVGDWEIEPYVKRTGRNWYQPDNDPDPYAPPPPPGNNALEERTTEEVTSFGIKAAIKPYKALKCGWDLRLIGANIRTRGHLSVSDGNVNEPVTFVIDGIDAIDIGLLGGLGDGGHPTDNVKVRIEVPVDTSFGIPPAATLDLPLAVHLKFKFIVETAFSGANSTMWAKGEYKVAGPIGIENGAAVTPTITVTKPMIDDIHGILVGASGIVIATEFRWLLGGGTAKAMFGPYAKLIFSVGTSRGSFMGFELGGPLGNPIRPVIDCRGVKIKADMGFGMGLVINEGWKEILDKWKLKTDSELVEKTVTVWNPPLVTQPVSAICREDLTQ